MIDMALSMILMNDIDANAAFQQAPLFMLDWKSFVMPL